MRREREGERVLLVGHRIGVMAVCSVLEGLDEHRLLELADAGDVPNCPLSTWHHDPGGGTAVSVAFAGSRSPTTRRCGTSTSP